MGCQNSARKQFIIFLMVGVLNTIFGYSVFALFIFLGMHYGLAVFLATCVGVLFNFKTIGSIVFKSKNSNCIWRFISVYIICYGVNVGVIKVILLLFSAANIYVVGAVATFIVAILSFSLNKYWVFRAQ